VSGISVSSVLLLAALTVSELIFAWKVGSKNLEKLSTGELKSDKSEAFMTKNEK